jgi:heme-degrading monooxygenase HmoA
MFVALSKFVVANKTTDSVKAAFLNRPHLVDTAPGFVRLDVISPDDCPDEIWIISYWKDGQAFHDWHKSHLFRDSHEGIPKGMKLVRGSAQLRYFKHLAS